MSMARASSNAQRLSSPDDCGLWMKVDLSAAMMDEGPESAQRRRDDDALPSPPPAPTAVMQHYYGVIEDDDVFMPPPPPLCCAAASSGGGTKDNDVSMASPSLPSREVDDVFMLPSLPPLLACTASSLPADGSDGSDDDFIPPPFPASCAAFFALPKTEGDGDASADRSPNGVTEAKNLQERLTSPSLEDSSGGTEAVQLESKKGEHEDIIATNKEQESPFWDWDWYCDDEMDTYHAYLKQTPLSCDMPQTRQTESTGECQVIGFLYEDASSMQCKPELDDRDAVAITARTSPYGSDSAFGAMLGALKNDKTKMDTAPARPEAPGDVMVRALSNAQADIGGRALNYDAATEQCVRGRCDLPSPWPLISRGSSIEDRSWTASILQGDLLLQRLLLVQMRQSEGQVWSQGVGAELAKSEVGDWRVERGALGVEGTDRRHLTTEDEGQWQDRGGTSRLEHQDRGGTEHERCETRTAAKSTPPAHQTRTDVDAYFSDDDWSDSEVPADPRPIRTQEIPLPQIHQCMSSETSTEMVQGTQDLQRARMTLSKVFQQGNKEGPSRPRRRHPASKDRTRPSILPRAHSLETFSLKRVSISRSQSFRLQRPETSEGERSPGSQKCKRPVGGARLSPYPRQDIPPIRLHRSMESLNLHASAAEGDTGERKQELTAVLLKENPFFKLRPALALQPHVERDIRESREREEELRRQRCSLYGETGRHHSEDEDPLATTSTWRAADDRLQSKGKLDRVWPPPSNKDQLSSGQTQETKVHKPGLHRAALW